MTLRGHVSLGEGGQGYNRANQLFMLSFCQFWQKGCDWGLYLERTFYLPIRSVWRCQKQSWVALGAGEALLVLEIG